MEEEGRERGGVVLQEVDSGRKREIEGGGETVGVWREGWVCE